MVVYLVPIQYGELKLYPMRRDRSTYSAMLIAAEVALMKVRSFLYLGRLQLQQPVKHRFMKFVGVSGIGWIIDTLIYVLLVALGVSVITASILGALNGAAFSFVSSSRFIFKRTDSGLPMRLIIYLLYTLLLVVAAAWVVERVTYLILTAGHLVDLSFPLTLTAFVAKCLVTPFLLATNFVIARTMLAHGSNIYDAKH